MPASTSTAAVTCCPAYAAAVTLFLIGVLHLVRRSARPLVFGGLGLLAVWFSLRVLEQNYLTRYFGDVGMGELLRRISYDRPPFITSFTLWLLIAGSLAALAGFVVLLVRGARREEAARA